MNKKKIVAGLLVLTLIFGGAVLPNVVVDNAVFRQVRKYLLLAIMSILCWKTVLSAL